MNLYACVKMRGNSDQLAESTHCATRNTPFWLAANRAGHASQLARYSFTIFTSSPAIAPLSEDVTSSLHHPKIRRLSSTWKILRSINNYFLVLPYFFAYHR